MKKKSNEKETPFQKAHEQFDVQTMIKNVLNQRFPFFGRYTVRQFTLNRQKPPPSRCQVPIADRLTVACRGCRISTCWNIIHVSGRFSSFAWLRFHGEQPFAQGIYPWGFFFACTTPFVLEGLDFDHSGQYETRRCTDSVVVTFGQVETVFLSVVVTSQPPTG